MAEDDWPAIFFHTISEAASDPEPLHRAHEVYCTSDEVLFELDFSRDGHIKNPPQTIEPVCLCPWIIAIVEETSRLDPDDSVRSETLARAARGVREAARRMISRQIDPTRLQIEELAPLCREVERVSLDQEITHISKAWQIYYMADSTLVTIGENREGQESPPPNGVVEPVYLFRWISEQAQFCQLPRQSEIHVAVHFRGLRAAAYKIMEWYANESSIGSGSTFLGPSGLSGSRRSGTPLGRRSRSSSSGKFSRSHHSVHRSEARFSSDGARASGTTHLVEERWEDVAQELPAPISECITELSTRQDPNTDTGMWANAGEFSELVGVVAQLSGRELRRGAGSDTSDEISEILEVLADASACKDACPASVLAKFKEEFC